MRQYLDILIHSIMITSFVFVMMLIVEYLNVLTRGKWQEKMASSQWMQYLICALLGATPGCLGAFMTVSMYTHRMLSLGAVVTAMIATSGDEAFVMFAMMPDKALLLTFILAIVGIFAGIITDHLPWKFSKRTLEGDSLEIHVDEEDCECFQSGNILSQVRDLSLARGVLLLAILILISFLFLGALGPAVWNWKKITILILMFISLFIVITVPEHFLEEHLWEHVAKEHTLRIFVWTLGAFIIIHFITNILNMESVIKNNSNVIMMFAGLVGLIPESGPHMFFITLYSKGMVPFSIILASSIVQDGHGMLPLLGHSRRDFIVVKLINLAAGLAVGYAFLLFGL